MIYEITTTYPNGHIKREAAFSLKELENLIACHTEGITTINAEGVWMKRIENGYRKRN